MRHNENKLQLVCGHHSERTERTNAKSQIHMKQDGRCNYPPPPLLTLLTHSITHMVKSPHKQCRTNDE
jgi:hypothetical protein